MPKYIKAEEGPKNSVIYYDEEGNKLIRYWKRREDEPTDRASTRSWRNNNPGNLMIGPFARRNGAIGEAGLLSENKVRFAVFPDYATGRLAQAKRLKEGSLYIDLTLHELPRKYLGVKPGQPDTEAVEHYRRSIREFSKLDMQRTIRSLNDEEYERLLDAMKRHEGWREGREEYVEVSKILNVRCNARRIISEFLVASSKSSRWLSKQEAISWAQAGRLHAVVVHAKQGIYLRPEHHQTPFQKIAVG